MPSLRFSEVHETSLYSRFSAAPSGGSFAFVMATGIVAIAAQSQGLRPIGIALFALNSAAFAILLLLMAMRVIRNRSAVVTELSQHRTAAGFLTIVAGTAVLGDEVAVQLGARPVAAALWLAACGFWVGFGYAFFVALATSANKSSLAQGLDGTWLLVAVATESLAVLATHVAGGFARPDIVVWLGLSWFLLGVFFYLIVIVLVLQRWLFEPLLPDELTPPYWINMGAMAIATLAGAQLEFDRGHGPAADQTAAGSRSRDDAVLGRGHLVDPADFVDDDLAACRARRAALVSVLLLVDGLPAGHVHCGNFSLCPRRWPRFSRMDPKGFCVDRAWRVGSSLLRHDPQRDSRADQTGTAPPCGMITRRPARAAGRRKRLK